MEKSAVEWLFEQLTVIGQLEIPKGSNVVTSIIKQANEMFKQQIIDCGNSCAIKQHLHIEKVNKMSMVEMLKYANEQVFTFGEEYYNETFNKSTQWQWYNEDQTDERMNVIGQNGNDGEHYNNK